MPQLPCTTNSVNHACQKGIKGIVYPVQEFTEKAEERARRLFLEYTQYTYAEHFQLLNV